MQAKPALAAFALHANACVRNDFHDGFLSLGPAVRHLAMETDALSYAASGVLDFVRDNPTDAPPGATPDHLELARGSGWILGVGVYRYTPQFIYTLPQHVILAPISDHVLTLDHYERPVEHADVGKPCALGLSQRHRYRRGDMAVLDARCSLVDIVDPRCQLVLRLLSEPFEALQWSFCRRTRQPLQSIAATSVDSELVVLARALGAMGKSCSLPVLHELAMHRHHFVRWAALQAIHRIDSNVALPLLENARVDNHPHVRRAAAAACSALQARPGK